MAIVEVKKIVIYDQEVILHYFNGEIAHIVSADIVNSGGRQ